MHDTDNERANNLLNKIIAQFKLLRLKQTLSHDALAKKIGVTRPAISYIEAGKRTPSLMLAIKMAQALGKDLSEILRTAEQEEKEDSQKK